MAVMLGQITGHAQERMLERGVPDEAVDEVLANYHTSRPAGPREGARPAVIYVGTWNNRNLRVYVVRDSNPPLVTSVAWEV